MVDLISPATAPLALVALSLTALAACAHAGGGPPGAAAPAGPRGVVLDERFETARAIPALATYEQLSPALEAQLEAGGRWHLILDPSSTATARVAEGSATIEIARAGTHWYSVQLAYLPVRLRPAMAYAVKFRAMATRPLVTTFDLAHVGDGWRSYSGLLRLELGAEWQEFEVRFETGPGDSEDRARFEFNFGNEGRSTARAGDVVRIAAVQVVEEGRGGPR